MSNPADPARDDDVLSGLPMQPTGSGPADLEVAYEHMRLAESAETGAGDQIDPAPIKAKIPIDESAVIAESSAHPS